MDTKSIESYTYKHTLYYSLQLINEHQIHKIYKIIYQYCTNIESYDFIYPLHITVLYTGLKKNNRSIELEPYVHHVYYIYIDKIAISKDYITLSVSNIVDKKKNTLPYYGNKRKHITFAISKNKKQLKAANSTNAFQNGHIIYLSNEIKCITKLYKISIHK